MGLLDLIFGGQDSTPKRTPSEEAHLKQVEAALRRERAEADRRRAEDYKREVDRMNRPDQD